ncbi:MAG: hydantoinase B/oxoprolinase family protein [Rhodovarius sp.]|nr:hydantoinase B/oxoprolinase family protein [Rhodovarius sp.]MDW8315859.1 hydantoinase B/oxoprolinase family protein [Rhodovarius sp.]
MSGAPSEIALQIIWNRLIAVVEEQAQTLVRTAFSTSAREAGDISAGVFDPEGRMLAQAVTGTPGHVNSMARSVGHFLQAFPPASLREGDILITNDPWKGTGHLFDLTVVTPVFLAGRLVALFASTTHVVDIGGLGASAEGRQIYHEGLYIPLMHLARQGELNEDLLALVRANVREPVQVLGDIHALIACNRKGAERLVAMMREFGLTDLSQPAEAIIARSRRAMGEAIARLPQGSWSASMTIDGFEAPVTLAARLTIAGDRVLVDYAGTSGLSRYAINCPLCYTEAYTCFAIKAAIAPWIPNNTGTLDAVVVTAPENSIVNAPHPAAVFARSVIGHMLPDLIYGCLDQALPETVPAEGTSSLWNLTLLAGHGLTGSGGSATRAFTVTTFHSGGAGARPRQDGLSATPFPSGVRNVPVEITEAITPLVIWRKELRCGSGGPGRQRGGLGQRMVVGRRDGEAFALQARFERVRFPARGRAGGWPGAAGRLSLASGAPVAAKGLQVIPAGDRLVVEMPGGGGYGDPLDRDPALVARDLRYGLIEEAEAREVYGVILGPDGEPDGPATDRQRAALRTARASAADPG